MNVGYSISFWSEFTVFLLYPGNCSGNYSLFNLKGSDIHGKTPSLDPNLPRFLRTKMKRDEHSPAILIEQPIEKQ